MQEIITYLRHLNMGSMMLRITLAVLLGGVVGFDREKKGQPAGFRTYMLVALGAAVTMILGQYLSLMLNDDWILCAKAAGARSDVVRIGAQVINGIGFLGTGTILVTSKSEVKGLTTASGLWASACMGIAVGAGFYEGTLIGFLLLLTCIKLLPYIENAVMSKARNMNIYMEMESIQNIGSIVSGIKASGIILYDLELDKDSDSRRERPSALISMRLPRKNDHTEVLAWMSTLEGVTSIDEI